MKILLINPKIRHENIKSKQKCYPPIALMYLAASLINHGHEVKIFDANALSMPDMEIIRKISNYNPGIIGVGLCSEMLKEVYRLVRLISQNFPDIKIVLGGPHASALPHTVLKEFGCVDFVVRGESEYTLTSLCDTIDKKQDFKNIKGISYKKDNEIIHNPPAEVIKNLDDLSFPARELLKDVYGQKKYFSIVVKNRPIDIMITSRGCPFSCKFCYNTRKVYRPRSVKNVLDEILEISSYKIKNIEILDDLFTFDRKRAIAIFEAIKKENLDITFRIKSRVDTVNRELIDKAKSANVYLISYGAESGVQQILNNMDKRITLKMIEKACEITKQAEIKCFTSWIIGFPGETLDTINQTIKLILKIKPFALQLQPLLPYPNTRVYDAARSNGTLVGDWSIKMGMFPWVKLPWMKNYDSLLQQVRLAKRKIYLKPYYTYAFFDQLVRNFNLNLIDYGFMEFKKFF